jgi:hypothetical protein
VGFFAYWIAFALLTVRQGQYPGLIARPQEWQHPYGAVVAVCALLAVLLAILYAILPPARFPYSWRRLVAALLYSTALFFIGIPSVVTDLPGYYYVLPMFGLVTMVCVLAIGFVSVFRALRRGSAGATQAFVVLGVLWLA